MQYGRDLIIQSHISLYTSKICGLFMLFEVKLKKLFVCFCFFLNKKKHNWFARLTYIKQNSYIQTAIAGLSIMAIILKYSLLTY